MSTVILQTETHKIETAGQLPSEADLCRIWRDSELLLTDSMLQSDRPDYQAILAYRQQLRDYPNDPDFPNNPKPKLGV